MRYFIFVIGCQMNLSDAERIRRVLDDLGYTETREELEADLLIAVACSVRQKAADRIYGKIRNWNRLKKTKALVTVLTGCVLPADQKKCLKLFDLYFPIKDLNKLPRLLKKHLPLSIIGRPATRYKLQATSYFQIHPTYQSNFQAYLPIMTGCDNFCTYCAVPFTRGRETSRSKNEIINEAKDLIRSGYKEITLLGQNVNSYGSLKSKNNQPFVDLLKTIDQLPGYFWLRFLTNHPKDMSEALIKTLPKLRKFCHYLHLPLQSGDNQILKRMSRPYTTEKYLKLIQQLRKVMPDLAISTDIIVGFPGETKTQFQATARMMKKVKFDMAYLAEYSSRPGTPASRLKDNVSPAEKKRRERNLNLILEKTALANNKKLLNTLQEVLVEKSLRQGTNRQLSFNNFGRTRTNKPIKFQGPRDLTDQFVRVKVISATPWALSGRLKS